MLKGKESIEDWDQEPAKGTSEPSLKEWLSNVKWRESVQAREDRKATSTDAFIHSFTPEGTVSLSGSVDPSPNSTTY